MEAIAMCLGTTRIRQYPSNTTYLFITRVTTCFDPTGSSSGLHYEPNIVKKLHKFLGSQTVFTIGKHEVFVSLDSLCTGPTACTETVQWNEHHECAHHRGQRHRGICSNDVVRSTASSLSIKKKSSVRRVQIPGARLQWRLNFCTLATNVCGPSVWNWLNVTLLWRLEFWNGSKVFGKLVHSCPT